jgi:prepilin-type N-terminal cleavage/methylation domain-containing protein
MFPFNSAPPYLYQQQVIQQPNTQKNVSGFSLIELMVVMAIMAVLMSLSGGLMQKSINQQARQVELEQVSQLFKKLSYKAYYGGGAIQVRLEKNQMKITNVVDALNFTNKGDLAEEDDEQYSENQNSDHQDFGNPEHESQDVEFINFEQLTFVAQDYNVSSKGIVSPSQYQVFWLAGIKTFELKLLFSEPAL